jgi:two-component system sensor histidine kinase KdpD
VLKPLRFGSVLRAKYIPDVLRAVCGIALVLLATWVGHQLRLNLAATSLLQLLVVLAVALRAGFWHATVVSALANCCLDYFFIPPVYTFHIADPQNWVTLIVFEISALVVSRLSTEAKRQAVEATRRRGELEQLYEISRQLLLLGREQPLNRQILSLIQKVFLIEACVLFDACTPAVELLGRDAPSLEAESRGAYLQDRDSQSTDGRTWFRVLRLGVRPVGSFGLRGDGLTGATVNALASLTAIALERAHSFERESRAEAERQSEQLRTTVLDALAHEYKTPLTAVRTATSGLIEMGGLSTTQSELITLIDSETSRLTDLTTRLLQMSRLDRVDIHMRPERIDVDEFFLALLSSAEISLSGRAINIDGLGSRAYVRADRELVNMALTQFLDNAAKYSDPASTITVAVDMLAGALRVRVHNDGPPIPSEDRERIFERFYRSSGSNHKAAGTGIGLSISKKIAEVHQGRVWVTSKEGEGTTFFLELPRCETEQI